MAKNKKAKHAKQANRARGSFKRSAKAQAHAHGRTTSSSAAPRLAKPTSSTKPQRKHNQPSQSVPFIPFPTSGKSSILLVGEGDFSFADSLATHHRGRWRKLYSTSLETREGCIAKYAQSESFLTGIEGLEEDTGAAKFEIDATKLSTYKDLRNGKPVPKKTKGKSDNAVRSSGATGENTAPLGLRNGSTQDNREQGGWDWIVFNFPHVGGLSKDQRRQVRANQEMLVGFFESAKTLLRAPGAPRSAPSQPNKEPAQTHSNAPTANDDNDTDPNDPTQKDNDRYNTDDDEDGAAPDTSSDTTTSPTSDDADPAAAEAEAEDRKELAAGGRILLTIFDGLPYTLWNVRDLARHAGLVVERSFRFQASAYPGYEHARTLGNLKARPRKEGADDGDGGKLADDAGEEGRGDEDVEDEEEENDDDDTEGSAEREARIAAGLDRAEVKERVASAVGSEMARGQRKRPGAWHGEERPARSYVFALSSLEGKGAGGGGKKGVAGKRKRGGESEDDDSD